MRTSNIRGLQIDDFKKTSKSGLERITQAILVILEISRKNLYMSNRADIFKSMVAIITKTATTAQTVSFEYY